MNYTELLDRFWGMDRTFSDKEVILYHYLLYRCNSFGWPDTFSLSNEELIGALMCRPTAMRDARSGLVEAGLISFQARFGRGENSVYSITDAPQKKVRNGNTFSMKKRYGMGTPFLTQAPLFQQIKKMMMKKKVRNGNTFSTKKKKKSKKRKYFPLHPL